MKYKLLITNRLRLQICSGHRQMDGSNFVQLGQQFSLHSLKPALAAGFLVQYGCCV